TPKLLCALGSILSLLAAASSAVMEEAQTKIRLPTLPQTTTFSEIVLFGFDDRAFPYQNLVQTHLNPGKDPKVVLRHGPRGAVDEVLLYYGTVLRVGDRFHLWYTGNYGALSNNIGYERVNCRICYATSKDGATWVKPNLGLVEFNGSKENNIVELDAPT